MLIPHSRHHKGFASTKWNLHPARRPGAGLAVPSAFSNSDGTFCGVAHDIRELGDVVDPKRFLRLLSSSGQNYLH